MQFLPRHFPLHNRRRLVRPTSTSAIRSLASTPARRVLVTEVVAENTLERWRASTDDTEVTFSLAGNDDVKGIPCFVDFGTFSFDEVDGAEDSCYYDAVGVCVRSDRGQEEGRKLTGNRWRIRSSCLFVGGGLS